MPSKNYNDEANVSWMVHGNKKHWGVSHTHRLSFHQIDDVIPLEHDYLEIVYKGETECVSCLLEKRKGFSQKDVLFSRPRENL